MLTSLPECVSERGWTTQNVIHKKWTGELKLLECTLRHAMSHYVSFQIAFSAEDHLETCVAHILTLLVYKTREDFSKIYH